MPAPGNLAPPASRPRALLSAILSHRDEGLSLKKPLSHSLETLASSTVGASCVCTLAFMFQ